MLVRWAALALPLLTWIGAAQAVVPRRGDEAGLVASAGAKVATQLRQQVLVSSQPLRAAAWQRFAARGRFLAQWDRATKVPLRIFGEGIPAPGSMASSLIAESWARTILDDHLDLLAPGAVPGDFTVVSNLVVDDMRVVGFAQSHRGWRVVGGQVSVRFKNDRLFVIGSEALPEIRVAPPRSGLSPTRLAERGRAQVMAELGLSAASAKVAGGHLILPLIGDASVLGYRLVTPVEVDAGGLGRWLAYLDDEGDLVARQSARSYASGRVLVDAVVRHPGMAREPLPLAFAAVKVDGAPTVTAGDGAVSWAAEAPVQVAAAPFGDLAAVTSDLGATAAVTLPLSPDGTALWSAVSDVAIDAQLQGYVHALIVKEYVRSFAPMAFLDQQLPVRVNIDNDCNAYSDGVSINFYQASEECQNTALLADVVYHEFGHVLHHYALIDGVGRFEGAMSEGLSDFLAASITNDPAMGPGFFFNDEPLRHIDPPDKEHSWPLDIGEVHYTGLIFAGAMWDLRKQLIADLGEAEAVPLVNRLFLGAIRNSSNIPSSLVEVLATDDDNGNLFDGTPHECSIRAAFAAHGLRTMQGVAMVPGALVAGPDEVTRPVELVISGVADRCPSDQLAGIDLEWRPRAGAEPAAGTAAMIANGDRWTADLPLPSDGRVILYRMVVKFAAGGQASFPDNRADPYFELFQGEVETLYCTGFETDPFAAGWRHGGDAGIDRWEVGPPQGGIAGDPASAHEGTQIIGTELDENDGAYGVEGTGGVAWLAMPPIELGQWSDVHLQFWRWLTVEDAFFDQATITIDGETAWQNYNSNTGNQSTIHHQDLAWVFRDVPVSARARGGDAEIVFSLDIDQGLNLGGWNLDEVCVVANVNSICGDGVITGAEQCDDGDGNADLPDTCRALCRVPTCGDAILDSAEQCDDGDRNADAVCTPNCQFAPGLDDQCECSGGRPGPGQLAVLVAALLLLVRRRRVAPR